MLRSKIEYISKELDKESSPIFTLEFMDELPATLEVLGEEDSALRDEFGWNTLSKYFQDPRFPVSQRANVIALLLTNDFLFFNITNGESSSSVKRTFSLLALSDLIWGDNDSGASLETSTLTSLSETIRKYLSEERDLRGKDGKTGWIHSYAHAGDCLVAINSHPSTQSEEIFRNIEFIFDLIESRESNIFQWDEHARLSTSIGAGLERLSDDKQLQLFEKFNGDFLKETPARQNLLNTFRSLYVELHINKFKNIKIFKRLQELIQ